MPPHAAAFVQKLAGVFGVKAALQGSGRKRFLLLTATPRTRLPAEPADRERLAALLASQERAAAVAAAPLRPAGGKGARPHWAAVHALHRFLHRHVPFQVRKFNT